MAKTEREKAAIARAKATQRRQNEWYEHEVIRRGEREETAEYIRLNAATNKAAAERTRERDARRARVQGSRGLA